MNIFSHITLGVALFATSAAYANEPLTVYTSRGEELITPLLEEFTTQTGIEVQVLSDGAPKLIARMQSEGAQSPADIFLPADVASLEDAAQKGLLREVNSEILDANIPQAYRDPDHMWFGLGKRARVIAYVKGQVDPATELSTYEDLADPKWKGEILLRSSSHPYNLALIAAMIENNGAEAAETWVKGLVANLARAPQGGDRDQLRAIAAGEGKIALVNSYYYALMKVSDVPEDRAVADALEIYFPNQNAGEGALNGAHVNVSGAGVLASSDQYDAAVQLMEFLSSIDAQTIYAEQNQEFPVNPTAKLSEVLVSFGEFKEDATPLETLASHVPEALKIADRSGWN